MRRRHVGCDSELVDVVLRPLRPNERAPVLEVFAGLSERSRRLRFLSAMPSLPERDVAVLVDVGCCGREAVAAIDPATGRPVGLARFVRDEDAPEAEIAFEVIDEWQGHGVGKRLVAELAALARKQGILRLHALVARENRPALALVRSVGDVLAQHSEGAEVELVVRLS